MLRFFFSKREYPFVCENKVSSIDLSNKKIVSNTGKTLLIMATGFPPQKGGIPTYTWEICKQLTGLGYGVVVLATKQKESRSFDRNVRNQCGIRVYRISSRYVLREISFFLYGLYCRFRYGISAMFATIWFPCGIIAFMLSKLSSTPYVIAVHAYEVFASKDTLRNSIRTRFLPLIPVIFNCAYKIFCVSHFTRSKVIARGTMEAKALVFLNGVDPIKYYPMANVNGLRQRYPDLAGKKILVTVAEIVNYKGQDTVLRALPAVLSKHPDVIYAIVGEGSYKLNLKEQAAAAGLQKYVLFVGKAPDAELIEWYNEADVYVMPSRFKPGTAEVEGFGISFVEANACGLPCIGGNSGGVPDAVLHKVTGELVDPENIDELADTIIRFLNSETLRRAYGENGRKRVERELSWEVIVKKMAGVFDEAIKPCIRRENCLQVKR